MLTKIFDVRTGEMTHRGIWELHCGSRQKGQDYLSRAAKAGDGYAKKIMVLNGLQLPDPEISTYGGGAVIDVYIHK